jgi:prepilin-type N-terminal cleavage/methylation domain-containing protein
MPDKRDFLSAFSLIEVLIALLIASIGVLGAGKLLLVYTHDNKNAEHLQKAIIIASAVADSVSMDPKGVGLSGILKHWQTRLEAAFPGSVLSIERQILEEQWYYSIHILFASKEKKEIVFKIAV